jgi:hypothetical protein
MGKSNRGIPAIYTWREAVDAGDLMGYAHPIAVAWFRSTPPAFGRVSAGPVGRLLLMAGGSDDFLCNILGPGSPTEFD